MSAAAVTPATPAGAAPPPSSRPARTGAIRDEGAARHPSIVAERWTARGIVKVVGDADVGRADLDGQVAIGGTLTADAVQLRGSAVLSGAAAVTGALTLAGELRAGAALRAGDARLDGQCQTVGPVQVERLLSVRGALRAPSVAAGEFHLDGAAEIPGDVRALLVDARFRARSQIGSVAARTVRLTGHPPNLIEKVLGRHLAVSVGSVSADRAEIVGVDVELVEAKEIVLGRDAQVTAVEGTIVRRHPSARVGPRSKSPPPYGLRR